MIGKASAEIVAYLGTLRFEYEEGEEGEEGEKDGSEQGKRRMSSPPWSKEEPTPS